MDPARWQRIEEIFYAATEAPPAERERILSEAAVEDPTLREEVERLLRHASTGLAADELASIVEPALGREEDPIPPRIGAYRPVREIGRGGMGAVWLAERAEGGFEQTVAIKLVKRGMDTREILRLFEQERQILSRLNHPHIARLLDGGATPDGLPYLVMEFIEGRPVVEHARELPPARVLELFLTICGAVQHAHSNLVEHRDLKPANILVNQQGEPKLLDFGIAKILEGGADALQTRTSMRMFTPAYASPEQQEGRPSTTATDIFALGAILRTLLGERASADAKAIIARATRPEPAERYATVEQLAQDVRRAMDGRPVEARQGNFSYVARRFLRRHRWSVAAAAAFVLLLGGSLFRSLQQSRQIARERDRAETVSRFLTGLFAAADPEHNQGRRLTIDALLDDGLNRARGLSEADTRFSLMDTIAVAYFNLGQYAKSAALHEELLRAYRQAGDRYSARAALALGHLAEAEASRDHHEKAAAWGKQAVEEARGIRPPDPAALALALRHQCAQLHLAARFDEAVGACRESAAQAAQSKLDAASRVGILVNLGRALQDKNQLGEAEQVYLSAMPLARASGVGMNSSSALVLSGLSSLFYRQDKFPEAERYQRQAIEFKRKLYPNGHLDLARSINNLANIVSSQQRDREAVPIFEEAHRHYRQSLGPESSELATSLSNLAMTRTFLGQHAQAAALMEEVMGMQARTVGEGRLPHINSQIKYASIVSEDLGQPAKARGVLEAALAALGRLPSPPPMQTNYAKSMLGFCLLEAGQAGAAERLSREAREGLKGVLPPGHRLLGHVDIVRAGALARLGRRQEARDLIAPQVKALEKDPTPGWRTTQIRRIWAQVGRG